MTDTTPAHVAPRSSAGTRPLQTPGRLTIERIEWVTGIPDARLRNLWITHSYADLAQRMLALLGHDQSWCSFATWASNTAGVSIRGRELPRIVARLAPGSSPHADAAVAVAGGRIRHHHLRHLVQTAVDQVSEHIAHGNTLVYAELAPVFVRFLEHVEVHGATLTPDVDALLATVGVPDADQSPLVRRAFRHYAIATGHPDDRAQHVLAANVAAVLHEQQRLQADIAASLDAGLIDVASGLEHVEARVVPAPVRRAVDHEIAARVEPHVERLWGEVTTHLLMTLEVPGRTLHLGRDVPAPPGCDLFPPALARLTLPDVRALMDEWDPTGGTGTGSGASDWADIRQRMGYIVNLFRSRQRSVSLTAEPFTAEQLAEMSRGEIPETI